MFLLAQHCQIYTNTDRDPPPLQHVSTVAWKVHSGIGTSETEWRRTQYVELPLGGGKIFIRWLAERLGLCVHCLPMSQAHQQQLVHHWSAPRLCTVRIATCCWHYRKSSMLYNFLFSAQDRKFTWCGKWLLLPLWMWECWCRRNSVAPECFLPLTRIHQTSITVLTVCCFPGLNFMPLSRRIPPVLQARGSLFLIISRNNMHWKLLLFSTLSNKSRGN